MHDEHFVVRILHTSCWRLIQPVKMYINWYMMWYLKKDMLCKEHIFSNDSSFLKRSVCHPFFGRSRRCLSSSGHVPHGTRLCLCAYFVRTWNFTIVCAIVLSDRVHNHTNDLYSQSRVRTPGLARDLFCGSRVRFPGLAAWSFCGPRVQFSDRITCFRPIVSLAYVTCPHDKRIRLACGKNKTSMRKILLSQACGKK